MTLNKSTTKPEVCPLCGSSNACAAELARVTGEAQPPCWCMQTPIPASVLERLPAEARGRACICQRCAMQKPAPE